MRNCHQTPHASSEAEETTFKKEMLEPLYSITIDIYDNVTCNKTFYSIFVMPKLYEAYK